MLTDLDKHSVDRRAPMPNTHDVLDSSAMAAKGTNSVNYVTPSTNQSIIQGAKNGQFTIVGSGAFTTTTNINIASPGAGNYVTASVTLVSQPHGLPFTPGIIAYATGGLALFQPMPAGSLGAGGSDAQWLNFRAAVDATNAYIIVDFMGFGDGTSIAPGFAFKWYLLQQTSS